MTEMAASRPGRLVGPEAGELPTGGALRAHVEAHPGASGPAPMLLPEATGQAASNGLAWLTPGPAAPLNRVSALPVLRRAAAVQARAATEGRGLPYHVAIAVGAAAGLYAVSLAAVTALQAGTDASVEAARRPSVEAIAALRASHDGMEAAVARIEADYAAAVDAYDALAARLADHETTLGGLAEVTGAIEGTAAALPSTIRLPALSRAATRVSSRPATNATTAASGKP